MLEIPGAPAAVSRLLDYLRERDGKVISQIVDSPSNQIVEIAAAGDALGLRIAADKGRWSIEMAPGNSREYFDSAVWRSCVERAAVKLDLESIDDQVDYFIGLLSGDLPSEIDIDCLRSRRRDRALRRMGLSSC